MQPRWGVNARRLEITLTGVARWFIVQAEMPLDTLKLAVVWKNRWRRYGAGAASAVLLCLGIGLRVANLHNVTGRTPDETVYTKQTNVLLQSGNAGLRVLVAEYQNDPTTRLFPPPTRIGYLWLLAATMRLTGKTDESAGAYLSCAASIGSLLLLALFGLRFFPPWAAVGALLFFAVSPFELELARRTWGDALVGLLALALVAVSAQITRDSRQPLRYLLFALLGGFGILVKESWPIVLVLCTVWVLWVLLIELKDWKNACILFAGATAAVVGSIAWLASSVGGFSVVAGIFPNLIHANSANPYALEYQSGPGYLLLQAFWVLTPLVAILCPLGVAVIFFSHPKWNLLLGGAGDRDVMRWSALLLLSFFAIPMILPHWLNLRYLSPAFGPFYLAAGVGLRHAASGCWARLPTVGRIALALLLAGGLAVATRQDYQRFRLMFVTNAIGDLSIKLLLDPSSLVAPAQSQPSASENRPSGRNSQEERSDLLARKTR
ncbi:MAG: hypothetical protein HY651_11170 [Acidobacteria bacterium]|nr:hypothetical protein [Acidobacteriota bacterium]